MSYHVASCSSNTPLGRNVSCVRFRCDVHFTDRLHVNITHLINAEFPDLKRHCLINVVTEM